MNNIKMLEQAPIGSEWKVSYGKSNLWIVQKRKDGFYERSLNKNNDFKKHASILHFETKDFKFENTKNIIFDKDIKELLK